jgi:very-short-patch-repair endonuclease
MWTVRAPKGGHGHSDWMPRRVHLPVTLASAPFITREADLAGVTRERLRSGDVRHPFHGVNSTREATDLRGRCEAFLPLLRPGDAFSHSTAAALVGAPLPRTRDTRVHVTTFGGENRFRRQGVIGHRATDVPIAMHLGIPIVEPAHAWVQLATILTHDDLVAVGDYLVTPDRHRGAPAIASIDALRAAIPERARGAGRARRALADVRVGPESRMETLLRLLLVRSGLPEPLVNPELPIGDVVLHPDLLYPQWRIALEYEGDLHRTDPVQWRRDIWRRELFEEAGWRVIRVHRDDLLAAPERLLSRVARVIAQRQRLAGSGTLKGHPRPGGRLSE